MHIQIIVTCCEKKERKKKEIKKRKIQLQRLGTNVRVAELMTDCCLEVGLHSEGPATGQLNPGFPWVSLVKEQMLSWHPNSTLHCMRQ
jgi:hypothetical protein